MKTTIDMTTFDEAVKALEKLVPSFVKMKVVLIYKDGKKKTSRIARATQGGFIIMFPGSQKYGVRLSTYFLEGVRTIEVYDKEQKNPEIVWRESWEKTLKYLDKSGLWSDMAQDIRVALDIGYEKIRKAGEDYWHFSEPEQVEVIRVIDPRLVEKDRPKTEIIWYMSKVARIKTTGFGKWDTQLRRRQIKDALENKTPLTVWGKSSYDVTYTYRPESNKAWYSEEYRGCGNGHYYLALDDTHALFYEDD